MARTKRSQTTRTKANQADKNPLDESHRPAGYNSEELQDVNWRHGHEDLITHAQGDSYRPDYRANSLEKAESHRPGHSSHHSYRTGQDDFYKTRRQGDSYPPESDLRTREQKTDSYRPRYETATQDTPPVPSKSSKDFTSLVDYIAFSFERPAPPPPSPEIAAMDVDMEELTITTSKLTVGNEESPISDVELTRELLLRGVPMTIASLHSYEKVSFIPLHKSQRRLKNTSVHSVCCKKCGKLQSVGNLKKGRDREVHACGVKAVKQFTAKKRAGGWGRVLRDLESRKWTLGPDLHDDADHKRYLEKEFFELARRAGQNGKDLMLSTTDSGLSSAYSSNGKFTQDDPAEAGMKEDAPSIPDVSTYVPPLQVKNGRKGRNLAHREKAAENRAIRAIVNMQLGANPSEEERAPARVRAREIIRGESGKQDAKAVVPQQALPAFDLRDLGKQLDSLSSAATHEQDLMPT